MQKESAFSDCDLSFLVLFSQSITIPSGVSDSHVSLSKKSNLESHLSFTVAFSFFFSLLSFLFCLCISFERKYDRIHLRSGRKGEKQKQKKKYEKVMKSYDSKTQIGSAFTSLTAWRFIERQKRLLIFYILALGPENRWAVEQFAILYEFVVVPITIEGETMCIWMDVLDCMVTQFHLLKHAYWTKKSSLTGEHEVWRMP